MLKGWIINSESGKQQAAKNYFDPEEQKIKEQLHIREMGGYGWRSW